MWKSVSIFLLCSVMSAGTPWTPTDTALEVISEIGIGSEWAQMLSSTMNLRCSRDAPQICGIDAKILGKRANRRSINTYFFAWGLAHPVISYAPAKSMA